MLYVYTRAHCGVTITHGEFDTLAEAHERASERREWLKKQGCECNPLSPQSWEVLEPDGCVFIPDYVGILYISKNQPQL